MAEVTCPNCGSTNTLLERPAFEEPAPTVRTHNQEVVELGVGRRVPARYRCQSCGRGFNEPRP